MARATGMDFEDPEPKVSRARNCDSKHVKHSFGLGGTLQGCFTQADFHKWTNCKLDTIVAWEEFGGSSRRTHWWRPEWGQDDNNLNSERHCILGESRWERSQSACSSNQKVCWGAIRCMDGPYCLYPCCKKIKTQTQDKHVFQKLSYSFMSSVCLEVKRQDLFSAAWCRLQPWWLPVLRYTPWTHDYHDTDGRRDLTLYIRLVSNAKHFGKLGTRLFLVRGNRFLWHLPTRCTSAHLCFA